MVYNLEFYIFWFNNFIGLFSIKTALNCANNSVYKRSVLYFTVYNFRFMDLVLFNQKILGIQMKNFELAEASV
jgi:hypothetical protein